MKGELIVTTNTKLNIFLVLLKYEWNFDKFVNIMFYVKTTLLLPNIINQAISQIWGSNKGFLKPKKIVILFQNS
jgi:hypothetical protein